MENILMIAHFCDDFDVEGNNRFNYLANNIIDYGYKLEFLTSDFSHLKKAKRDTSIGLTGCITTYIKEPAYSKNVSVKRIYSHYIMSRNLKVYLKTCKKPDIIYCEVPSLALAKVASNYAREHDIPFIVDIGDLWPEAFKMVFKFSKISDLLFYPMTYQADNIYKSADGIVAVSDAYVERALRVNSKCRKAQSIYLGTELSHFDKFTHPKIEKPENEVWLGYIGTLGHSYDIERVIDALSILKNKGVSNIRFKVIGDGPLKNKFEHYARQQDIAVDFLGRLDYEKMVNVLTSCDIAINPIKNGSAATIINKVGDYAAAGLPVLNTQECTEYRHLIDKYKAGFNCENGDAADLAEKLWLLSDNEALREEMGKNNRVLAEEKFDRKKTYKEIVDMLAHYSIKEDRVQTIN